MNISLSSLFLKRRISHSPLISGGVVHNLKMRNIKLNEISSNFVHFSKIINPLKIDISNSLFAKSLETPIHVSAENIKVENISYSFKNYDLLITDTVFGNCKTKSSNPGGGAIYVELSKVIITNSFFVDNSISFSGGAIRAERCALVNLTKCCFARNEAELIGGAVSLATIFEANVKDSNFTSNSCQDSGATIAYMNTDLASLIRCIDYDSRSYHNGAFLFNNGETEIGACTFLYQKCASIYAVDFASVYIFSSTFIGSYNAVWWKSKFALTVQECLFDKTEGQCLYIHEQDLIEKPVIENCNFSISVNMDIVKENIPVIKYRFAEEKNNIVSNYKSSYAQVFSSDYVNIQNLQPDDTFTNSSKKTFSLIEYIITYLIVFSAAILYNYTSRKKAHEGTRGVLGQMNAGVALQVDTNTKEKSLNNEKLFNPV